MPLKFEKTKKFLFFSKSTRMRCTKFQVKSSKTVSGSFRTDGHTYKGPKQGNPVETEIPCQARYWLVNITGLRVCKTGLVSEYNRFV